jgi:hypothetical protein
MGGKFLLRIEGYRPATLNRRIDAFPSLTA